MKIRHLFFTSLLLIAACDAPPSKGGKVSRGTPPVIVEVVTAQLSDVSRNIERNGSLQPLREVRLSMQQEGRLLSLPFHEGDKVVKGEVVAQLDDTLLRAQLKKSQAQRRQAEQDLKRLKRLKSSRVVAEDELARAATALDVAKAEEEELNIQLQQTQLLAPFSGTISERRAEPGDTLTRYSHILSLIDTQNLTTELYLSELILPGLQLGEEVSITIDALGAKRFKGTIHRIHPMIDEASRQGTIEVMLSPPPADAQPGQLCRVALPLRISQRLMVPYNALRRDTRGEYLYTIDDNNKAQRRAIVSGRHFDELVEILDGLQPGERLITRGFLGLSEGGTVKVAGEQQKP